MHDPRAVAQAGFAALQRGKHEDALVQFNRLVAAGTADASVYFATAIAHQRLKDDAAARFAIDAALARDGTNFQFLLFKADLLAAAGDHRDASALYLAAVRAVPRREELPAELLRELERAEQQCQRYAGELEELIRQRLSGDVDALPRVAEALDILFGHRQRFAQQPRYFFFPGLATVQFFDPAAFEWVPALESHTEQIRQELLAVMRDDAAFQPYVEGNSARPGSNNAGQDGMLNNPDWSAFYLWKNGRPVEENAARCPHTVKAISAVPLTQITNRSPSVLFSLLRPGAHIPPHNGLINTRLIAHLPLIVPGKCRLRVGNETREWAAGKIWLFDDTIEHEAWNDSTETRVILLFEVNRPDVTAHEQRLVGEMFAAIDSHAGKAPEWEI